MSQVFRGHRELGWISTGFLRKTSGDCWSEISDRQDAVPDPNHRCWSTEITKYCQYWLMLWITVNAGKLSEEIGATVIVIVMLW